MLVERGSGILQEGRTGMVNYGRAFALARKCADLAPEGEEKDRARNTEEIMYQGLVRETARAFIASKDPYRTIVLRIGTIFAVPENRCGSEDKAEAQFRTDVKNAMERREGSNPDPVRPKDRQKMVR